MAGTREANRLTEAHRLAQARLGAQTVLRMLVLWPLLDIGDLDGSFAGWLRAATPVVQAQRSTSARLAGNYLTTFRSLELGVAAASFVPTLAETADSRALTTSLLVTGPVAIKAALSRGVRLPDAVETAKAMSAGAAMRHVLTGGRSTIVDSVDADQRALGWARATSGRPCHFCAMLASRGPAYKSQGTGGFEAHDHCNCTVEPVYRDDAAWPAGTRRLQQLWADSTRGLSGSDARNAFRQALAER